jgi:hypothetical protein
MHSVDQLSPEEKNAKDATRQLKIMFLLGIAWSANIGGTGMSKC